MTSSVLTLILAGGEGERLSILSQERAKPGVPFGGKYRIIDFALSNAVNSGLTDVAVLTQYAPRSLIDHIGVGRPWDLDRSHGGVSLLQPYIGRGKAHRWYRGTADAVLQNLEFIEDRNPDLVLILAGDHVYKMDYRPFIETHVAKGAEVTCAVRTVPIEDAHRFGIMEVDGEGLVTNFVEKPARSRRNPGQHGGLCLQLAGAARVSGARSRRFWEARASLAGHGAAARLRLRVQGLLAGRGDDRELLAGRSDLVWGPPQLSWTISLADVRQERRAPAGAHGDVPGSADQ